MQTFTQRVLAKYLQYFGGVANRLTIQNLFPGQDVSKLGEESGHKIRWPPVEILYLFSLKCLSPSPHDILSSYF